MVLRTTEPSPDKDPGDIEKSIRDLQLDKIFTVQKILSESDRLQAIETAILLARKKVEIRNKIINKSVEDPEFLNHLKDTLKRLGL